MTDAPTFTSLTPYLRYPDAEAALQWLQRVLGFGPYQVARDPDGTVGESTIEVGPVRVDVSGSGRAAGRAVRPARLRCHRPLGLPVVLLAG